VVAILPIFKKKPALPDPVLGKKDALIRAGFLFSQHVMFQSFNFHHEHPRIKKALRGRMGNIAPEIRPSI